MINLKIITPNKRNEIDSQIREMVLAKFSRPIEDEDYPTRFLSVRRSLGLGDNLEKACPYFRVCDKKSQDLCIQHPYRECIHYRSNLSGDIISGDIQLDDLLEYQNNS